MAPPAPGPLFVPHVPTLAQRSPHGICTAAPLLAVGRGTVLSHWEVARTAAFGRPAGAQRRLVSERDPGKGSQESW